MVGYLGEFGVPISFIEWVKFGLPIVPVLAIAVGLFMYIVCVRKFKVKNINPAEVVRQESAKLPRFGGKEAVMAVILVLTIIGWALSNEETFGLGGVTVAAVLAMFIFRIINWDNIQRGVAFDVVGLYAAACAIGTVLSFNGGALWLAREFVNVLPEFLSHGDGLVVGVCILTGTITNFMSDGATVASLGPIVLPMAELGNLSLWKVGLMCSYASSFAMLTIVGTPNNAIAYTLSKDPDTGKHLITNLDFLKYGLPVWFILMTVLIGWGLLGYWSFLHFPN